MEALTMGGYGIYVWACFGLTLFVVVLLDWQSRRRERRIYREIEVRVRALEERK